MLLPCPSSAWDLLARYVFHTHQTVVSTFKPRQTRCAGQVMVNFWWLERFSQIKFQNSKPRPTFLTQGIPKPCKPQHLEQQQSLHGLCIRQTASHSLMKNSHPLCPSHQNTEQSSLRGQRGPYPSSACQQCLHRGILPGWWVHACCSRWGSVPAALLGAWLFPSLVGTFMLHSFFLQSDVPPPWGLRGVASKRVAEAAGYTFLWGRFRLLQFPIWQSSQK